MLAGAKRTLVFGTAISLITYFIVGNFDIKQSFAMKRKQDRSEALHLPDEADPSTLLTLGQREFKNGNTEIAVLFLTKAKAMKEREEWLF